MKRYALFLTCLLLISGCGRTPEQEIRLQEKYLMKILPMENFHGIQAESYETEFKTDVPDGLWDCRDRSEYAKKYFERKGYKVDFADKWKGNKFHRFVLVNGFEVLG